MEVSAIHQDHAGVVACDRGGPGVGGFAGQRDRAVSLERLVESPFNVELDGFIDRLEGEGRTGKDEKQKAEKVMANGRQRQATEDLHLILFRQIFNDRSIGLQPSKHERPHAAFKWRARECRRREDTPSCPRSSLGQEPGRIPWAAGFAAPIPSLVAWGPTPRPTRFVDKRLRAR